MRNVTLRALMLNVHMGEHGCFGGIFFLCANGPDFRD
jgi:hypothetical protein